MYPVSTENSAERSIGNGNGKVLCEVERLMQICYMVLLLLLQGSSIRKGVGFVCLLLLLLPQLYLQDLRQQLAYSRHLGIFVRWSNGCHLSMRYPAENSANKKKFGPVFGQL